MSLHAEIIDGVAVNGVLFNALATAAEQPTHYEALRVLRRALVGSRIYRLNVENDAAVVRTAFSSKPIAVLA